MNPIEPKGRPSIRDILSPDGLRTEVGKSGMSEKEVAQLLAPIPGLRELFELSMKVGKGVGTALGISRKSGKTKVFASPYPSIVRATALALGSLGQEITALFDTPRGSTIEARLPIDIFSFGGSLLLEIVEEGVSEVCIIGSSEIKGQMFDWGKGKRALREVFDKIERYVPPLFPHAYPML